MLVAGAAVLRRTSSAPKSVCVSSSLLGPRSRVLGGLFCIRTGAVVCKLRRDAGRRVVHGRGLVRDEARIGRVVVD